MVYFGGKTIRIKESMSSLFDAVVQLLQAVCRATGLSYFEINILLYTFFVPATWWAVVWLRLRKWHGLWLLHLGAPVFYCVRKEGFENFSERFYTANTEALLWLGGGEEMGYVRVSILVGIVVPALIYLVLWLAPKRFLPLLYLGLMVGNAAWYAWACFSSDIF